MNKICSRGEELKTSIENEINKINNLYDSTIASLINSFKLKHEQLLKQENDIKEKLQNKVTKIKEELENNLSLINHLIKTGYKINKGYKTYNNEIIKFNYISKVNIIQKYIKELLIKSIKSIDFIYQKEKSDMIYNEYYFNGIFIPSNIEFKEISLSSVKIIWNKENNEYKNIDDLNNIKYIIEKKGNNKEFQKIYEGKYNYFVFKNISLENNFEFRICSVYKDLISPWSKPQRLNLCEMNNLTFIERLKPQKDLSLSGGNTLNDEFILLNCGNIQYGPYRKYEQGKYLIIYHGQNLIEAEFDVIDNGYKDKFNPEKINRAENKIFYDVEINKQLISGIEFRCFNNKKNSLIVVKYIDIYKFND